jgi:hypothetical protein
VTEIIPLLCTIPTCSQILIIPIYCPPKTRAACCWWGRGVFRHINHGRCFFGRLNHAIGKRAAMDGRPSLYPDIDFCKNPEAICSSQHSNELQWVVGMFHWTKTVQTYNENGWSFMDNLRQLPLDITDGRFYQMLTAVDCIMKTGNHRCNISVDSRDTLKEVLTVIIDERIDPNAPTMPPTVTAMPSVSPTDFPTGKDIFSSFICLASICTLILAV